MPYSLFCWFFIICSSALTSWLSTLLKKGEKKEKKEEAQRKFVDVAKIYVKRKYFVCHFWVYVVFIVNIRLVENKLKTPELLVYFFPSQFLLVKVKKLAVVYSSLRMTSCGWIICTFCFTVSQKPWYRRLNSAHRFEQFCIANSA